MPKRCHRRFSRRCLLGRLRGDLVPKRCHSRPSLRCLLGRLGGDVMPKPCHRRLSLQCLPPSRTRRHTRHTRSWHAVSLIRSVSAQPALPDRPCTFLAGAPSALCSALPPSRHLPTHSAHSLPLMAIIPASVPSAINRTVSPAVEKSGEAVASPAARNPLHGLASCGEIRRASRP